jgi:hypothetical protein
MQALTAVTLPDAGQIEAQAASKQSTTLASAQNAERAVAVSKAQLGIARMLQSRHGQALAAFIDPRNTFNQLNEPGTGAMVWHKFGIVRQPAGDAEAAEDAYRQSLAIEVRLGVDAGQASTFDQLGNLRARAEAISARHRAHWTI